MPTVLEGRSGADGMASPAVGSSAADAWAADAVRVADARTGLKVNKLALHAHPHAAAARGATQTAPADTATVDTRAPPVRGAGPTPTAADGRARNDGGGTWSLRRPRRPPPAAASS